MQKADQLPTVRSEPRRKPDLMGFSVEILTKPIAINGIIATEARPVIFENIVAMAAGIQFELQV